MPETSKPLDPIDFDIIRALQQDARLSVRELATRVHRSTTPVFERLRRLEAEGVIRGYSAQVDPDKLGRGFTVFCNVKLRRINTQIHSEFAKVVAEMPEVTDCFNVSGSFDYMLKVQVPDMKNYRIFVTDRLGQLEILDSVQSVFVMETIKQSNYNV